MNLRALAWLTALLPLFSTHGAYLLSASDGLVPWCFPYTDGCTSISRGARHGDANLYFRAGMLPYTTLVVLFWWLAWRWVLALPGARHRLADVMLLLGAGSALFLVVYVTFLGVEGPTYQALRRYGVNMYFGFSVVAQMLLIAAVHPAGVLPTHLRRIMEGLCVLLLLLGIGSLPLQLLDDPDRYLDAIEWNYALLMALFYPVVGEAWAETGFALKPVLERA